MPTCRLLIDPPAAGAWNMAVDEMLLERTSGEGTFQLRFYQWNEPTLSLGYFQAVQDRAGHAASRDSALVRRLSGGGAILHDRELTYSLAVPAQHPLGVDAHALYLSVHRALIAALRSFGVTAALRDAVESQAEPFLCFQRRSVGDVLVKNMKIAGSAERRRRGAILQHGSVILATSPAAPELPGILELTGQSITSEELTNAWRDALAAEMHFTWQPDTLHEPELARARELAADKFGTDAWNNRR